MITFSLLYSFSIAPAGPSLRLIVYKNGTEYICRKEKASVLTKFTRDGEGRMFKGRLQLHKEDDRISIIAGHEIIGTLSADQMAQLCTLNVLA